jgi:hypothetical protein
VSRNGDDGYALAAMATTGPLPLTNFASRLPSIFDGHDAIHENDIVQRFLCLLNRLRTVHCDINVEAFSLNDSFNKILARLAN